MMDRFDRCGERADQCVMERNEPLDSQGSVLKHTGLFNVGTVMEVR